MFELVGVDVELNFIAAAASSSSITLSAPLPDEQASSVSSLSPSPRPNAASCHKKTTPISGKPPFGGGGGATCAALSRGGRELPWAPANKEVKKKQNRRTVVEREGFRRSLPVLRYRNDSSIGLYLKV